MTFLQLILAILIGIILIYGIYWLVIGWMRRRSAKWATAHQLNEVIRKVQVVDVRELNEFDAKHILGARNIPMSQFKMRLQEIRKDIPVYLVDENHFAASRAANQLRKQGYKEVFILKGGMEKWFGKTKTNI